MKNKNTAFTKIYDRGWQRILDLIQTDPNAARLWAFLVRNAGYDNVIVCSMFVLSDELKLHRRTLSNKVKFLQKIGAMKVAKIGTANAYILNPDETWMTSEEFKNFHRISAQALIGRSENRKADGCSERFKKRMTHMVG